MGDGQCTFILAFGPSQSTTQVNLNDGTGEVVLSVDEEEAKKLQTEEEAKPMPTPEFESCACVDGKLVIKTTVTEDDGAKIFRETTASVGVNNKLYHTMVYRREGGADGKAKD